MSPSDLDEREAEAGGEGNGAGASDSGGALPGSAQCAGNAVEDGDNGGLFRLFLPGYPCSLFTLSKNKYY